MEDARLPAPEYTDNVIMLNVTIRNGKINDDNREINGKLNDDNGEINGNNGELNDDNGEINGNNGELNDGNGEINPALLYLNKSELAVYHLIENAPQNSRHEIADQLNISTRTVDRAIKDLSQKDLIVREGSKETGHWKINK